MQEVSINVRSSTYQGSPVVEWNYTDECKNFVQLNQCCAVRTRKGLCIIGYIVKIKRDYMKVKTAEVGMVTIRYSMITGMFPCIL